MGVCCGKREEISITNNGHASKNGQIQDTPFKTNNQDKEISDKISIEVDRVDENSKLDNNKDLENQLKLEQENIIDKLNNLEMEDSTKKVYSSNVDNSTLLHAKSFIKIENASFIQNINSQIKLRNDKSTATLNKTATLICKKEDFKIGPKISKNAQTVKKEYYILNKLGKGSFGTVYKVAHKNTGQTRAMKIIKKDTVMLQDDEKKFLKEIEILRNTDHMNIIKIFEYFEDEYNYYVITEMLGGGELLESVVKLPNFNEGHIIKIMNQLLSAVAYLHKNNITHRDLKPENILVDKTSNDNIYIKVIDFGTSNYVTKNKNLNLKVGSPYYIAPEVLDGNYNEKCDIWSCGCVLYVLLVGYPPFNAETTKELFSLIKNKDFEIQGEEWNNVSKEAKDLVKRMLNKNYNVRVSAIECLEHPYLKKDIDVSQTFGETKKILKKMKNFQNQDKLQQATIAYIVHFLTPSNEFDKLKETFKSIDKNKDGTLSMEEIKEGFEHMFGPASSELEIESLLEELDSNGDGSVSYEEFLRVVMNKTKLLNEKNLKLCFEAFDENKDNKLSAEEIKKALGAKDNEYVSQLINLIDDNKNSEIDFGEFKQLMSILLELEKNKNSPNIN